MTQAISWTLRLKEKMEKGNREYGPIEESKDKPKATDAEVADFFIRHIKNPCEVKISPSEVRNIREFYLREASRILEAMTDPVAQEKLQETIKRFSSRDA